MLLHMGWVWAVRYHIQVSMRCLWAYIYIVNLKQADFIVVDNHFFYAWKVIYHMY